MKNEKIKYMLPFIIVALLACVWAGVATWLYLNTSGDLQTALDTTKIIKSRLNTAQDILGRVVRQSREDFRTLKNLRQLLSESKRNREASDRTRKRIVEINETTRAGLIRCIEYSDRIIRGLDTTGELLDSIKPKSTP
jgi:hypothetical protein